MLVFHWQDETCQESAAPAIQDQAGQLQDILWSVSFFPKDEAECTPANYATAINGTSFVLRILASGFSIQCVKAPSRHLSITCGTRIFYRRLSSWNLYLYLNLYWKLYLYFYVFCSCLRQNKLDNNQIQVLNIECRLQSSKGAASMHPKDHKLRRPCAHSRILRCSSLGFSEMVSGFCDIQPVWTDVSEYLEDGFTPFWCHSLAEHFEPFWACHSSKMFGCQKTRHITFARSQSSDNFQSARSTTGSGSSTR